MGGGRTLLCGEKFTRVIRFLDFYSTGFEAKKMMRYLKRERNIILASIAFGAALCEEIVWSIASRSFMHHFPNNIRWS